VAAAARNFSVAAYQAIAPAVALDATPKSRFAASAKHSLIDVGHDGRRIAPHGLPLPPPPGVSSLNMSPA